MATRPNIFVRAWRYLKASLGIKFDEMADPKVQLEQAIREAQDQHAQLKQQAANVIANQKQTESKLERRLEEKAKLESNAQQALMMAEEARAAGNTDKAGEYENAAETIATKLIGVETEIEDLRQMHVEAAAASERAKDAVENNSMVLQQKLAERQQLLSQLDQAKMSEQMNEAMSSLNETVGTEAPSFNEIRDKIEKRHARAQGRSELEGNTVESRMLEIEQASRNTEAQARLSQLRGKLGIGDTTETTADTTQEAEESVPTPAELTGDVDADTDADTGEGEFGSQC